MTKKYYEFEVTLSGIKPRVWRRFLLKESATFEALHGAIQEAFGWHNTHLYEFSEEGRGGEVICAHAALRDEGVTSSDKYKLKQFFDLNKGCNYLYDYGDSWEHKVKLKRVVELEEAFERRLLAGAEPGAREDCGGVWGYQELRELAAAGDEEAIELLSVRPATFELGSEASRFDLPRPRRAATQAQALGPTSQAPKRGAKQSTDEPAPSEQHRAVDALLKGRRSASDARTAVLDLAQTWWTSLTKLPAGALPQRQPAVWAATLEYAATCELGHEVTKAHLGRVYGVKATAITQNHAPLIEHILEVERLEPPPKDPAALAAYIERHTLGALQAAHCFTHADFEAALMIWREFVATGTPLKRRAKTYIAAMEYITRLESEDLSLAWTQGELARLHDITPQTLASTAKEIAEAVGLELDTRRTGYWSYDYDDDDLLEMLFHALGPVPSWSTADLERLSALRRVEGESWELDVVFSQDELSAEVVYASRRDPSRRGRLALLMRGGEFNLQNMFAVLAQCWCAHPDPILPGTLIMAEPGATRWLQRAADELGIALTSGPFTALAPQP